MLQFHPPGLSPLSTLISFAVLAAAPLVVKLKPSGSIGALPFMLKTDIANGRNFTAVSAALLGGLGVVIDRLQIFLAKQRREE